MTAPRFDGAELARLFSLGANDARTPLATLTGYSRTLVRELKDDPRGDYALTLEESVREIGNIVEQLAMVARIHEGRYTPPTPETVATRALALASVSALGQERVEVRGDGTTITVAREPIEDALTACARAAMRHSGTDLVAINVVETTLTFQPIHENARGVLGGTEIREFGVAAALLVLRTLGSTTAIVDDRFVVELPKNSG